MNRISSSLVLAVLVLVLCAILPPASQADTITVNGHTADTFVLNTASKTFADNFSDLNFGTNFNLMLLLLSGTPIHTVTVDDLLASGVTDIFTFTDVFVTSLKLNNPPNGRGSETVDFKYSSLVQTTSTPGGPSVPEPSSLTLLGVGLVGLALCSARKLI